MPCRGTWNLLYQYQRWGETGPSLHSDKQHLPTNSKLNRNERNKYTKYTMKNGYFNQQNLRLTNDNQQRSKSDVGPCSEQANSTMDEPIWKKSARWIPDQIETQERVKCAKNLWNHPVEHLDTLWGINISHLGKRKTIFKIVFSRDMLVPRRVHFLWLIDFF